VPAEVLEQLGKARVAGGLRDHAMEGEVLGDGALAARDGGFDGAERASPARFQAIKKAYEALDRAIARGDSGVDQDFAFHRGIAEATENPQFVRFLEYLGRFIIPRQTVRFATGSSAERRVYLARIQKEHREIIDALHAHAPQVARTAMRRHLVNSRKRYQKLAANLGA